MNQIATTILISLIVSSNANFKNIRPQADNKTQAKAVQELIERIIPNRAEQFSVNINSVISNKDFFRIEKTSDNIIKISASTGVAAAAGFNHYLKYFCNCHISWESSQLNLPEILPQVNLTIFFNDKFRYYQNVCTTSYSFVWWDWQQWEKHIDWIVLNGFNLVLAFNGQEAIWERVYKKFNLTDDEINEHFTGPAFLAWLRMGNLRGWGGPLSQAWHNKSIILQKQILERMREFGIITVLPAFAGHLPRAFKRIYPDANMVELGSWNGFNDTYCCPYFLDPSDDLFNKIGTAFLEEMISEFGTDHVYNCDSFNENTPTSGDLTYLSNVGQSIFKAMNDTDPEAIWLMQNWLFVNDLPFWSLSRAKAILTSVPIGKMIVLDLQSEQWPQYERMDNYFGQPFIWCMLHNFGGTLGMFGSSTVINEEPINARLMENSTMVGIGLTPEGINQNYVIYEFMTETAWRKNPTNLSEWFENYSIRRYGSENTDAMKAWSVLQKTIYDYEGLNRIRGKYAISRSPSLKISIWNWYSTDDLITAWNDLLKASDSLDNPGYLHDLVDVTRQALQVFGDFYYKNLIQAYSKNNIEEFQTNAEKFLEIFPDLESILSTNINFMLGPWLESAKNLASTIDEEKQFEYNARNQITLWGPNGEIMDYANKQWSGIVSNYFAPRWQLFIDYLNKTLINNQNFNQSFISEKIFKEVEEPFTFDRSKFPVEPIGNTVEIAKKIYSRWVSDDYMRMKLKFAIRNRKYKRLLKKLKEKHLY